MRRVISNSNWIARVTGLIQRLPSLIIRRRATLALLSRSVSLQLAVMAPPWLFSSDHRHLRHQRFSGSPFSCLIAFCTWPPYWERQTFRLYWCRQGLDLANSLLLGTYRIHLQWPKLSSNWVVLELITLVGLVARVTQLSSQILAVPRPDH